MNVPLTRHSTKLSKPNLSQIRLLQITNIFTNPVYSIVLFQLFLNSLFSQSQFLRIRRQTATELENPPSKQKPPSTGKSNQSESLGCLPRKRSRRFGTLCNARHGTNETVNCSNSWWINTDNHHHKSSFNTLRMCKWLSLFDIPPKFNSSPLKSYLPNRKGLSSNH